MTKKELEQLPDLREEIKELEYKLRNIDSWCGEIVTDKVQASSREFPYTQGNIKIEGREYDYEGTERRKQLVQKKKELLQQRKEQAEALELRITQYINSIQNSGIRRMIEYKYIERYTWEKIGKIFHCERSTAEKRVLNYLKAHPET